MIIYKLRLTITEHIARNTLCLEKDELRRQDAKIEEGQYA